MAQGLLSSLANVAAGRATPIGSGLTAEQEARRRTELAQALVNLAEAESSITVSQKQLGMEGLESWSNVQTSMANAQANLVEAVASHSRAQAMDRASTADLLSGILAGPENVRATEAVYGKLTPEETKSDFNDELGTNVTAARNAISGIGSIPVTTGSTPDGLPIISEDIDKRITAYMDELSSRVNSQLGDLGGAAKVEHLNRAVSGTMNGVAILLQEAERAAGAEPGSLNNPDIMSLYARKLQNAGMGDIVTDDDRAEYEGLVKTASASLELTNARVEEYLGGGVTGVGPQLKRANDALARVEERLGGSPFEYLESLPAAVMPEGIGEAKELLRAELARLDAPDPLVAAVAEMQAMTPGFDVMREAMGFRSNEALAMFFKRNPDYYLDVMRKVRQQQGSLEFQDMIDLGSTDAMEDFLGTIKHSPPRVPYSPPSQGQVSTAAPQQQATLPDDVGGDLSDDASKPEPLNVEDIQNEDPPLDSSLFNIYDDDDEQEDIPYGTGMVPTRDPSKRFPGRFPNKKTEAFAQIQSDLQRRLSRILTPPTGDDTPPIKTA